MGLFLTTWLAGSVLTGALVVEDSAKPLLRFPDLHGDTVVFVHGEDLWKAPVDGGNATRLTFHDGAERFPKFSPDGTKIAFTAEYDGNNDVYVMNPHGGEIHRVTYHPGTDTVVGWHPDGNRILFRSSRRSYSRFDRLFLINPDGTNLEELMLHEAAFGSFSPDGQRIAYNRVARESRTWKRYQGGLAQDVYLFDFATQQDRKLTEFSGTDRTPMWMGSEICFASDRTRTLNLFAMNPENGELRQLTDHRRYDVRRPSQADQGRIVYEHGGEVWVLDVASGETRPVSVSILTDAEEARPHFKDVSGDVHEVDVSPSGKRALVVARGEVFTVPKEHGSTRNLTASSGSHEKDAVWSPQGDQIAYLSDQDGEFNVFVTDPLGQEARQITDFKDGYRHTLRWSPDGKKIAFADQTLRFFFVDVASGKVTEVDRSDTEPVDVGIDHKPIFDYQWSPDSRFLTYSKMEKDLVSRVYVYALEEQSSHRVSGDNFNDFGPVFTPDGKHLLFLSNRRFDPTLCDFDWEMVFKKVAGIYAVTLTADGQALLPLRSDEEASAEEPGEKKDSKEEAEESQKLRIDFEGLGQRIEALPVPRGNYRELAVTKDAVFFLNAEEGDFNRFEYRALGARDLKAFSFKSRKVKAVIAGIDSYRLSGSGDHLVYRKGGSVGILASSARDSKGSSLSLSGLRMWYEPRQEWNQIFAAAWRMERDFFYEPNMHGIDWEDMRRKYGEDFLPRVSCRQDLHYLIGEMIGELNTSHTYVFGGDRKRRADRVNVGLLGADLEVDAGRYRLRKILREADWTQEVYPPLTRPGLNLQEGHYLLAVNGQEVRADQNLFAAFQGMAGKQTTLVFHDRPERDGNEREVVVVPARSESTLRYRDWVEHNRRVVNEASNGRIGYMHLPDTYLSSMREFPQYFYSQIQKDGLIIDGRFNGGGLDPEIFLARLDRELLAWWTRRYSAEQTTPFVVTRAHMVCLTNRQAGSGGDMLPMEFQQRKMGPVIGTRTWGGLVGVSMFLELIDGGGLTAPDYRIYTDSGDWVVENEGVTPDIVVDLTPAEMARGHDAQLMTGVEHLLERIREEPIPPPPRPEFPADVPSMR